MGKKTILEKLIQEGETWILTDKNRYLQSETVSATIFCGQNLQNAMSCKNEEICVELTDPRGNHKEIFTICNTGGCGQFSANFEVTLCGMYTLVGKACGDFAEEGEGVSAYVKICSTCFFVGRRSTAATYPMDELIFFPEDWEEPESYKLASFFITERGEPIPFVPIKLVFYSTKKSLERDIFSDQNGNVFFLPYAEGSYCLIYRSSKVAPGSKKVSVTFSFAIPKQLPVAPILTK